MRDEKLKADKYRWGNRKFLWYLPQYRFLFLKRKCEAYRLNFRFLFYIFRFLYERYKIKYMMDIPARVRIGKGLRIEHIGNIVINPNAIIGENVTLLNGVLIGSQSRGAREGTPTIGNSVWIGTNAVVVGKINIGNNVLIAPGAFVNFDVPDNTIVLGNPGKIIPKSDATKGYIINSIYENE